MSTFFTYQAGSQPYTVQFTDQTTPPSTYWMWDFGDGSPPSFDQNPIHEFPHVTQVYEVTLQTDPYAPLVVSLMQFPTAVACDGHTIQSLPVLGDEKGIDWTLQSVRSTSSVIPPHLNLDQYADPLNPFGGSSVVFTDGPPSFVAAGDYTIEVTHNTVISNNNYGGTDALQILSAIASVFDVGPTLGGEWGLVYQLASGVGKLKYFAKKASSGIVSATINGLDGYPYPLAQDNVLALQRRSGLLDVYLAGNKILSQFEPADATPTSNFLTFGGSSSGCAFNNYGSGLFSKFRYTVGAARYTASYEPDLVDFITTVTLPVSVHAPPPPPAPDVPHKLAPSLSLQRLIATQFTYDD